MKRVFDFALMAVMTAAFSMIATSCKDDDKEPSEEEKAKQAEQKADADMADAATFWSVVGQLTDTPIGSDWKNTTYEPSIGEPNGSNTAVRIVSCADGDAAAESFAYLVGLTIGNDFSTASESYTYENPLVGTLEYHRTGGTSLATVDVNIKQMPGLTQIIYKSPSQIGENSSFDGTAYYRFGDVVKKRNADGKWDFWICVRPSLGPDGKGDSHWITLSPIPSENVVTVTKTVNGVAISHLLPKGLGTNKENMQNLAELLYAMTNPTKWASNLSANKGYKTLKYFKDLDYENNFRYNNEHFFKNVCTRMPDDVFQELFGLSKEEMRQELSQWGLHLVYNSASMSGTDVTLEVAEFTGANLKSQRYYKSTSPWQSIAFNINELMQDRNISNVTLTSNRGRLWVCRYASGQTLAKGNAEKPTYDKFKRLPNCTDVFVYNSAVDHLDMGDLRNIDPKVTSSDGTNKGYYRTGDIIKYDGRYYVCASNHDTDETARFISLNDQDTHSTTTFSWKHDFMVTNDVVYSDKMASAETAAQWMGNILFNKDMSAQVRRAMEEKNLTQFTYQVIPETEKARDEFVELTAREDRYMTNVNMQSLQIGYADYHISNFSWDYLHERDNETTFYDVILMAPYNYTLVDKLVYSTHLGERTDHWVPYLMPLDEKNFNTISEYLSNTDEEQQRAAGYFEWEDMGTYEAEFDYEDDNHTTHHVKKPYHIVKLAHYWYHQVVRYAAIDAGFVLDYTKDWLTHPDNQIRTIFTEVPGTWTNRCITSRELTFTDNGKRQTKYESIAVSAEE